MRGPSEPTPDEDEEGWAGTRLIEPLTVLGAAIGALLTAAGLGWWLHHTFVVPSRPPRSTSP